MIGWIRKIGVFLMCLGGVTLAATVLALLVLVDETATGLPESARQIQETRKTTISFAMVLVGMPLSLLGLWLWTGSWLVTIASRIKRRPR